MRDTFDIDSPFYDTAKNVIEIITDTLMEVSKHGEGEEVFVYFSTHGDRVIADPNTNNTRFQEFVYLPQCMIITAVSFLLSTCLVAKTYVCEFDHMLLCLFVNCFYIFFSLVEPYAFYFICKLIA
jgi:hypothetical protein